MAPIRFGYRLWPPPTKLRNTLNWPLLTEYLDPTLGLCCSPIVWHRYALTGASIPSEAMMHFPLFQISPYFQNFFRLCVSFPDKFLDFHPPNFLMTFFSHRTQISNCSPVFYFPSSPCFAKIIVSPLL